MLSESAASSPATAATPSSVVDLQICFLQDNLSQGCFLVFGDGNTYKWNKDGCDWAIISEKLKAGMYSIVVETERLQSKNYFCLPVSGLIAGKEKEF